VNCQFAAVVFPFLVTDCEYKSRCHVEGGGISEKARRLRVEIARLSPEMGMDQVMHMELLADGKRPDSPFRDRSRFVFSNGGFLFGHLKSLSMMQGLWEK
jgi:hypothetical protein